MRSWNFYIYICAREVQYVIIIIIINRNIKNTDINYLPSTWLYKLKLTKLEGHR